MLGNNLIAFIITAALALGWLRLNDYFAHKGLVSGPVSRKIIHIGTGPIFVLCWLLFAESAYSRYIAALIPLAITIQFALVGLGVMKDDAAVRAMSRKGDRKEILRGPLFYGVVFVILTIWFWKESPIGIVALMLLCGGDGLGDIVGKRFGKLKLPWSNNKSVVGSLAVFIGGWVFTVIVVSVYLALRVWPGLLGGYLLPITIIALVGALVESLPFRDIDNITVPVIAVILGFLILP
jgi:phytol kinase